jgi:hypothetical protein
MRRWYDWLYHWQHKFVKTQSTFWLPWFISILICLRVKYGNILWLEDCNLYLRLRKMPHTIYATNGKVGRIHRRMRIWSSTATCHSSVMVYWHMSVGICCCRWKWTGNIRSGKHQLLCNGYILSMQVWYPYNTKNRFHKAARFVWNNIYHRESGAVTKYAFLNRNEIHLRRDSIIFGSNGVDAT